MKDQLKFAGKSIEKLEKNQLFTPHSTPRSLQTILNFVSYRYLITHRIKMMIGQQEEDKEEIACIIYDECMYYSEAVAKHMNLPSIILRTTSASTYISRNAIVQLKADGILDAQSMYHVEKLHSIFSFTRTSVIEPGFKDLPVFKIGTPEIFLRFITDINQTRTSSAVIFNTADVLELSSLQEIENQCQVRIFPIGPLHKIVPAPSGSLMEEDKCCITWLDKQVENSVLYISLGSLVSMENNELIEMAWGLANSKQPFLWVIRPGPVDDLEWNKLISD